MPNHVYCSLKFYYHEDDGKMIEKVSQAIKGEDSCIDFNRIIKQPDGIQDVNPDILSDAEYNWNIENWGTKWNAYSTAIHAKNEWKLIMSFQTAWAAPLPIIHQIIALFPEIDIVFTCADEGGWSAYHITKNQDLPLTTKWESKKGEGVIISAIFEALNFTY